MLCANDVTGLNPEKEQLPLRVAFDLFEVSIGVLDNAALG